ncbi:hypothetical protein ROG8370_03156 [Roseovarius gaetbuli]|uniref:Uncharacterized protein n=2 Tax=Roseovarius gaetbuli TaxID=1356575 RepID=A0A1X7A1T1_9RHOB|nr:hypothetical protein ROG8370_03156 [Roseovarius gaetbuli]
MPTSAIIEDLWICPPLAFARFGQVEEPMVNFHWEQNDYSSRGTAETVIRPTTTFRVCEDGGITAYMPNEIRFRDGEKWLPVAPFFEVHGRLDTGYEGPITTDVLAECGLTLGDLKWRVHAANRKAFHYTGAEGDHVDAIIEMSGDQHDKVPLSGISPKGAENPIIHGDPLPLGAVQVIRPNAEFNEIRLRITPPKGHIYAPTNTAKRNLTALVPEVFRRQAFLDGLQLTLNPDSAWAHWNPADESEPYDPRTNPGGLYAMEPTSNSNGLGVSLGFLDDSNDGLISVVISGSGVAGGEISAHARFTCCPPDFQPDRRPFRSVADGLADLMEREDVSAPAFTEGSNWIETEMEIADFMQRVRETMEASNLDHQNLRSGLANNPTTPEDPFTPEPPRPGHPLPLTELGRANHKRFLAYDVFKARMAQRPELFDDWIRNPAEDPKPYDRQMPALMRGSDSNPMTITQRQYNLMKAWLERISGKDRGDGPSTS